MSIDYTAFEGGSSSNNPLGYWWRMSDAKGRANSLVATANHIREQQRARSRLNLRYARLYGNFDLVGFGPRQYGISESGAALGNFTSLNLIAALTDTLTNKIGKSRPRSSYQTFGGDWKLQRKAAALDKFTQGAFDEAKVYSVSPEVLRDACKFGTGIFHGYVDQSSRLRVERVLPDEVLVDDADGVHATPRCLYRQKAMPRELVAELFGSKADVELQAAIASATPGDGYGVHQTTGDLIELSEGWHLPSGKGAKDGKHILALRDAVLFEEDWTREWFPFVPVRYLKRDCGYWGQGIAERQCGTQLEINRVNRDINEALRLCSKPRWMVPAEGKVVRSHIRGGLGAIGDIVVFHGGPQNKPSLEAAQAVAPEHFAQLDRLWTKGFEAEGVSMMDATAQKPAGLDSRPALREYDDIRSERFALLGQEYEAAHVELARQLIDFARELGAGGKGYKVNVTVRRAIWPVEWKDINLEEEQYRMQAFPVSSLPTTPAARLQVVDEWVQRGWVSPEEAPRLMNMPDLEETSSLMNAALDDVDAAIDDILDGGDAEAPDDFENINLRIHRGMAAWLRARRQSAPPKVLEQLRTYVLLGIQKQQRMQASVAPAAGLPAGGPPGAGPPPGGPSALPGAPPAGPGPVMALPPIPQAPPPPPNVQ